MAIRPMLIMSSKQVIVATLLSVFFLIPSVFAIQINDLTQGERRATIYRLMKPNQERIWVPELNAHRPACMIDVRYLSAVYLNGKYLAKAHYKKYLPMCPISCVRPNGINVCDL